MAGLSLPDWQRYSPRVATVLGKNPSIFTGPGTNTFLVGSGDRPLLLDTGQGVPVYLSLLEQALEALCGGGSPQAIVVTHAHVDHLGGVRQVAERFGEMTVSKMPWPERDEAAGGPIRALAAGDVIETEGATLRAVHTPGHAPDHLCYYLVEERALFTGDVVLGAGTTVIPDDGSGDLAQYMNSLRRLLELDVAVIYPGHGPAISDPSRKIRDYISHRELRDRQIVDSLDALGRPCQVMEIVERIYTDVPVTLHRAAANSVTSHLRKLRAEGVVEEVDGRWQIK